MASRRRVLEIFILPLCFGCEIALDMAKRLQAQGLDNVEIRIVNLSDPQVERPVSVFAVPTYQLDGQVVSLGNPEESWLIERLTRADS